MDRNAPIFARIPPPLWTLLYIGLAWAGQRLAGASRIDVLSQPLLGWPLVVLAIVSVVSAALSFRRAGTDINPASESNRAVVTGGPYRFTRNPMYLGLLLASLGIAFLVGTWPYFLVPLLVFLTNDRFTIPYEEAKMARQFGETYLAYKRRVRRWL